MKSILWNFNALFPNRTISKINSVAELMFFSRATNHATPKSCVSPEAKNHLHTALARPFSHWSSQYENSIILFWPERSVSLNFAKNIFVPIEKKKNCLAGASRDYDQCRGHKLSVSAGQQ
jgi:hypothetical protein